MRTSASFPALQQSHLTDRKVRMSKVPDEGLILTGGCYCSAVRYSVTIPALSERPIVLPAAKNEGNGDIIPPAIIFDHCNDCRKAGGAFVQSWFNCPRSWVKWSVPASKELFPTPQGCIDDPASIKGGPRISLTTEDFVQRPALLESFVTHYNSSPDIWRTFCTRCGTNLTYVCSKVRGFDTAPMVDLVLGSLDRESLEMPGVRPDRHFFWNAGIEWIQKVVSDGEVSLQGQALAKHPGFSRLEHV
jgi:hypothetical protein